MGWIFVILPLLILAGIAYGVYFFYVVKFRTKRATPNQALLITGRNLGDPAKDPTIVKNEKGNYVKIVRGGNVRLKFQQYADKIDLNSFQIDISVNGIMVKGDDKIDAEAVVQIAIGDTNEHVLRYAEQFLGKDQNQIISEVRKMITTHFRSILTTLTVEAINADREKFNESVAAIASKDLDNWGFKLLGFGLGELRDSDKAGGYLSNSERIRKAEMNKQAENAESEAEREIRIRKAEDEKQAKEIENQRAIEIAESNKIREIQEAEIQKQTDKAKAEAEVVYELEKASQMKKVVLEQNEIERLKREGERQVALVKAEEDRLLAEKMAEKRLIEEQNSKATEKIRTEAEAEREKIRAEADAEVVKKKAEAEAQVELERARAEKEKQEMLYQTEADRLLKIGQAEAESIRLKGEAEANAQKALAEAKLIAKDIHLQELAIQLTPQIAESIAMALGSIGEIKIYSTNGSGDQEGVTDNITSSLVNNIGATYDIIRETTGLDLTKIAENKSNQPQVVIEK